MCLKHYTKNSLNPYENRMKLYLTLCTLAPVVIVAILIFFTPWANDPVNVVTDFVTFEIAIVAIFLANFGNRDRWEAVDNNNKRIAKKTLKIITNLPSNKKEELIKITEELEHFIDTSTPSSPCVRIEAENLIEIFHESDFNPICKDSYHAIIEIANKMNKLVKRNLYKILSDFYIAASKNAWKNNVVIVWSKTSSERFLLYIDSLTFIHESDYKNKIIDHVKDKPEAINLNEVMFDLTYNDPPALHEKCKIDISRIFPVRDYELLYHSDKLIRIRQNDAEYELKYGIPVNI